MKSNVKCNFYHVHMINMNYLLMFKIFCKFVSNQTINEEMAGKAQMIKFEHFRFHNSRIYDGILPDIMAMQIAGNFY